MNQLFEVMRIINSIWECVLDKEQSLCNHSSYVVMSSPSIQLYVPPRVRAEKMMLHHNKQLNVIKEKVSVYYLIVYLYLYLLYISISIVIYLLIVK